MRGDKNQSLNYSYIDETWSTLDANILANAADNDVVEIWNLSQLDKQKQWFFYNDYDQTAHAVILHNTDLSALISGHQDGSIKRFDIRTDTACSTFYSNSESVIDVKFSPYSNNLFSAFLENGTVQLWDLRRSDKSMSQFPAHLKSIYSCYWHPTRNSLATGSLDKHMKVWNMEHKIKTLTVKDQVKWHPKKTYHIASCSLQVNNSIHIWDTLNQFLQFCNDYSDLTAWKAWKSNNLYCTLSTSRDYTTYQHPFKDDSRTALQTNIQGAGVGRKGEIFFVNKSKFNLPVTTNQLTGQRSIKGSEQFDIGKSDMCRFFFNLSLEERECFIGCAKELFLTGSNMVEIFKHNANVCRKYGKYNTATLWSFLEICCASNNSFLNQKHTQNAIGTKTQDDDENIDKINNDGLDAKETILGPDSVILSETEILSEITFDNFDSLRNGFIYVGQPDYKKDIALPRRELHSEIQEAGAGFDIRTRNEEEPKLLNLPATLKVSSVPAMQSWEPHEFLVDSLMLKSDVGDVQTAITVLLALGENRKFLPIEESLIEYWFHAYISQLHRYQMWNEACTIINLSWFRSVRELNQKSTIVHTNCGDCGQLFDGSVSSNCQQCKSMGLAKCSICDLIVRGLYAWCQGCSHGGHIKHVKDYFANHSKCPKCGHLCEFE